MARQTNKLTAVAVKAAASADHAHKLADGGGLTLVVKPPSAYWHFRYRFVGKEQTLALGVYPQVTLQQARQQRDEARILLDKGINPTANRRAAKAARSEAADNSFQAIALEWFETKHRPEVVESHSSKSKRRLEQYAFPLLGRRPISEIEPPEVLEALRRIENSGHVETAHRVKTLIGQVFRYAISTSRAQRNVTVDLEGALRSSKTRHHAAITDPVEVGPLLRAIDSYKGMPATCCALRLAPLLMVRPGELRQAKWCDVDLQAAEWQVVAKGDHPLLVNLPAQAVAILREMEPLSGGEAFVFPSNRGKGRPLSNGTVNSALRSLGYGGETMSGHGFRAMARTILVERLGFPVEIVEMQLGHRVSDMHGRAYNRVQWRDERREMMQVWADYLDTLRAG